MSDKGEVERREANRTNDSLNGRRALKVGNKIIGLEL